MPTFKVAHVREQNQNMLLFPLDGGFAQKSNEARISVLNELELQAHRAGLAGRAAAFWVSNGQTHSIGPKAWKSFLRSLSMSAVLASVNKEISW
jgi:hypothetical protein